VVKWENGMGNGKMGKWDGGISISSKLTRCSFLGWWWYQVKRARLFEQKHQFLFALFTIYYLTNNHPERLNQPTFLHDLEQSKSKHVSYKGQVAQFAICNSSSVSF
jgi:hypothetical protein